MTNDTWPNEGTFSIEWNVSVVDGRRRLGWKTSSVPQLDPALAIALLRDIADELEIDLPERD